MPTSEHRSKAFTYPWWIINCFTLAECFLKIFNIKIQYISFIIPTIQTVKDWSKTFRVNQFLWQATPLKFRGAPCPIHGNWHSMLLLMLLMRWAEELLLPGTSIIMPHCNPKCQRTQTCTGKGQQASRTHACFNTCFALGNIRHSTRRRWDPVEPLILLFFPPSPSAPQVLWLFHQRQIWPVTHRVQETMEVVICNVLISKCFICLSLDIQIAHCCPFCISIFFLLP